MRFADRVAIITGGGRGIGAATVQRFAQDGAAVVIADLDEAPARAVAAAIEQAGGRRSWSAVMSASATRSRRSSRRPSHGSGRSILW